MTETLPSGYHSLWLIQRKRAAEAESTLGELREKLHTESARADGAERSLQDAWKYHRELMRMSSPKPTPDGR